MPAFHIFRFDPRSDEPPAFHDTERYFPDATTVYEALCRIRDDELPDLTLPDAPPSDPTGATAMVINGRVLLAAHTTIGWLETHHITITPLPNFDVIRDLVIDPTAMLDHWHQAIRELPESQEYPGKERLQRPRERARLEPWLHDRIDGTGFAASSHCRVNGKHPGPEVFVALARAIEDSRQALPDEALAIADGPHGVFRAHVGDAAAQVSPLAPNYRKAVRRVRREVLKRKLKRTFGLKG